LLPELAKNGVVFVAPDMWTEAQAEWLQAYFSREVEPVLSPLALDPARPFPEDSQQEPELRRRGGGRGWVRAQQRFGRGPGAAFSCRA
jgi:hypothetical protein